MFCSFELCRASGGNDHFGNTFYCNENPCTLSNLCALSCFDRTSVSTGDSVFVSVKPTLYSAKEINATKCLSKDGSSSISVEWSTADETTIKYLNAVSGVDHNSLETWDSNNMQVYFTNIINSTENTNCVINNHVQITLTNCCFVLTHSTFSSNAAVTFYNCSCDNTMNNAKLTKYPTQVTNDFRVDVKAKCYKVACTNMLKITKTSYLLYFVLFALS